MTVDVDNSAGFCWGVVRTLEVVEEWLERIDDHNIYILGEIIHNPKEIERLESKGLKTVTHDMLPEIAKEKNAVVIIRAHGEPPSTYETAEKLGLTLVDATCPLVKALQKRVHNYFMNGWQVVIYGKREHAEVIGLRGVCNDECIVVKSIDDAKQTIDLSKKTVFLSQTTMDKIGFEEIKQYILENAEEFIDGGKIDDKYLAKNTICKYVADRELTLTEFSKSHDVVIFVAGRNSSNGKSLFEICRSVNSNSFFIEDFHEIQSEWFDKARKIGITGATSTPQWFMELVKSKLLNNFQ